MKPALGSEPGDERPRDPIVFDRPIYSRPDDDHVQDLAAALGSLKLGTLVHSDSDVDFAVRLDGQMVLGQVKVQAKRGHLTRRRRRPRSQRQKAILPALLIAVTTVSVAYLGWTRAFRLSTTGS